jgi:hypothetical protein
MTAQYQDIMDHVLRFLTEAADGEWDHDFMIEKWNAKENDDAIKQMTKPTATKTSAKLKDPSKPKRGKTAYMLFCTDERPTAKAALLLLQQRQAKPTEVTTELGRRWNVFKDSTKPADQRRYQKYVDAAAVDKQRYDDEMADYVAPSDADLELLAANRPKRGRKSTKTTDDDAKPKRGKSSYLYFCAASRQAVKLANPDMVGKEVTAELGRLWRELKVDDEREDEYEEYQRLAAADKQRYEDEMAALAPTTPKAKTKAPSPVDDESDDDEPVKPKAKKAKTKAPPVDDESDDDEPVKQPRRRAAYHCFCDDHLTKVTVDHPDMTKAEVRKELTAMWKELTTEEKAIYKR